MRVSRSLVPALTMLLFALLYCAPSRSAAVSGQYLDVSALLENRLELTRSPLLAGLKAPRLEPRSSIDGYRVSSANLLGEKDGTEGFIVLVDSPDGSFTALLSTPTRRGVVIGHADGSQTFTEEAVADGQKDDFVTDPQLEREQRQGASDPVPTDGPEQVLTVLVGFSEEAARQVVDPRRFALAQIETLNLALKNSLITNVRVTLSGISTTPIDYVINSKNLSAMRTAFPNYPNADLIAGFFASATEGGVVGIASRYGNTSMTRISTTDTFAHEVGHNMGGAHCNPGDDSHEYGFTTGKYGSLLCRQGTPYLSFSNPARSAPDGAPLGNSKTADMARVWREKLPNKISGSGNDASKPILVRSLADPDECLDVLDGKLVNGAKVGLWKCDPNNPNQRWNRLYIGSNVQYRLVAKPTLCLYAQGPGSERPVIVTDVGCEYIRWSPEGRALKIRGNEQDLYLYRSADNQLTAGYRPAGDNTPKYHWTHDYPYSRIVNKHHNLCLSAQGDIYEPGTPIIFWRCVDNAPNQRWLVEDSGHLRSGTNLDLCLGRVTNDSRHTAVLLDCNTQGSAATSVRWDIDRKLGWITAGDIWRMCLGTRPDTQAGGPATIDMCGSSYLINSWSIEADR